MGQLVSVHNKKKLTLQHIQNSLKKRIYLNVKVKTIKLFDKKT